MEGSKKELAVSYFLAGDNCAQSVARTFAGKNDKEQELVLSIAQSFGGGIARTGGLCGAVSGALMAIGAEFSKQDDPNSKDKVRALCANFMDEFKKANGALNCKDLLVYDISTEDGRKSIHELHLREKVCKNLINSSAEILEKMIK